MKKLNKLSIAVLAATASTFVSAVELGEIKGTTFSIGGYLKAEAIWGMPDVGDNTVEGTARQSRFNIKAEKNVDGHKVAGFVEADFWENQSSYSTTPGLRLRHAYINIDALTVGQTWSGNFFATAPFDARMINFFGPGWGSIAGNGGTVRPSMVAHYRTHGFTLSAAEPLYDNASMPDLVVSYAQRFDGGSGYSAAITAREVEQLNDDSEVGAAVSFQGKLAVGNGALFAGAFTGKGQGVNSGLCVGGAWNPGITASCDIDASGDLISQTGYSVGVTQNLTPSLNGTLRYGKVEVDDAADTSAFMTTATLMYSYLPDLDFGIEWRDQDMKNHPLRPAGQQVEVMAMYKF
ncbi:hypothetical protein [Amphritea sp.]|uniref:hypothetical protein n=1 Tax=Amphritea sp. TaxID=1872502 RepID=UPI003A937A1B